MKQPGSQTETENLILTWKRKGKYFERVLCRDEIFSTFEGLMKGFPKNNRNAKIIVKVIPIIEEIYIDFDSKPNEKKLNFIMEKIIISSISIKDCHIAIWAIWNAYCMDGNPINPVNYIKLTD